MVIRYKRCIKCGRMFMQHGSHGSICNDCLNKNLYGNKLEKETFH